MTSLVFFVRDADYRRRMVELLSTTMPDVTPIGQALDGDQFLAYCRKGYWTVAVIDLLAPSSDPVQLLRRLQQECPHLPVVAIFFMVTPSRIDQVLRAGTLGLVAPEDVPEELEAAIRSALAGKRYLSRVVRLAFGDGSPP
jgi:DNA-binding NarL/FixJ family response regulator